MAGAIPTATAIYHHAEPPRSLDACSTAAPGLRSRACAAVRCSCWWTASATPRRRRWPLTSASAIPSYVSVRPLGSATCSTTTASRRPASSRALGADPAFPRVLAPTSGDHGCCNATAVLELARLPAMRRTVRTPRPLRPRLRARARRPLPPTLPVRARVARTVQRVQPGQ